ncbi:replication-relaxation family protein [Micromonospora sp. WMMD1082]|uniref:replication-relaxation family protein n=1 Tax=Micromonospora sp. WMMD1082 TaxID=3016104 RepID=UPI00241743DA|nr:replication-relaxation family protein [Micromonospora sp. WMMD1082]MDG4796006.1 replication-relaxation family protein [Micromonospora sp. WMMD1082]
MSPHIDSPTPAGRPACRVEPVMPLTCANGVAAPTTVEPIPARPRSPRAHLLRKRLSDRDLAVLQSLAMLRLLRGDQVQRLHVAEGSAETRARRARALLQRLAELKLVVRLARRVGGVRAGSAGYVYGLSGHGQAVLAVDGPTGGRRRRVWETSPSFMGHVLDGSEVYIRLVEAERTGKLEILNFQAEPAAWRHFPGPGGPTATLKPDGFVRLGIGDVESSAFLEVDRGTESVPTLVRKCRTYAAYWQSGIEQAAHAVFPRVLWLASGARSAERITRALTQLPADTQHLFHTSFLEDVVTVLTATALGGRSA